MGTSELEIFHRPKIDSSARLVEKLKNAISIPEENQSLLIPENLQLRSTLSVPYPLQASLSVPTTSGSCYVAHCGAGPENIVIVWTKEEGSQQLRKFKRKLDCRMTRFVFVPTNFLFFASCDDFTLRVFAGDFYEHSKIQQHSTVLSMLYDDVSSSVVLGLIGCIQQWKLNTCLHLPPSLSKETKLKDRFSACTPWITFLHLAAQIKQFMALASMAIFFLDCNSLEVLASLENRHDFPLTVCLTYMPRQYLITGSQEGVIKVWSMTIATYPFVVSFCGHTKRIISLHIHPSEPILISISADLSIRMWRLETFQETYRMAVTEAIMDAHFAAGELCCASKSSLKIFEWNLFHSLFSVIGSRATAIERITSYDKPTRILYVGEDGGIRIISPTHGNILTMAFPLASHRVVQVEHDPGEESIFILLEEGDVLVASSKTNPCRTVMLWQSLAEDDRVVCFKQCCFYLREEKQMVSLLLASHADGRISSLRGTSGVGMRDTASNRGVVVSIREQLSNGEELLRFVTADDQRFVLVWKFTYRTEDRLLIPVVIYDILLKQTPTCMALSGMSLAVACATMLTIYNLYVTPCGDLSREIRHHNADEEHKSPISHLTCCPSLGIFASSSCDGSLKFWNYDNQIVREMKLDSTLAGVTFANNRGDVMVGFQNHLYYVSAIDYLPVFYLKQLLNSKLADEKIEYCLPFDPHLKFWFDESRVQTTSLRSCNERRFSFLNPESRMSQERRVGTYTRRKVQIKDGCEGMESPNAETGNAMDMFYAERKRRASHAYDEPGLTCTDTPACKVTNEASINAAASKPEISEAVDAKKKLILPIFTLRMSPVARKYWPCAPDGFVPNSSVRLAVCPRPPRRPPSPQVEKKWCPRDVFAVETSDECVTSPIEEDFIDEKKTWASDDEEEYYKDPNEHIEDSREKEAKTQPVLPEADIQRSSVKRKSISIGLTQKLPQRKSSLKPSPAIASTDLEDKPTKTIQFKDEVIVEASEHLTNEKPTEIRPKPFDAYAKEKWFPHDTFYDASHVVEALLARIPTEEPPTVRIMLRCIADAHKTFILSDGLLDKVISQLLSMLDSNSAQIRHYSVLALLDLGVARTDVILRLVRKLDDPVEDVRNAVKQALRDMAGIQDTQSLIDELTKLGVLRDNRKSSHRQAVESLCTSVLCGTSSTHELTKNLSKKMGKSAGFKKARGAKSTDRISEPSQAKIVQQIVVSDITSDHRTDENSSDPQAENPPSLPHSEETFVQVVKSRKTESNDEKIERSSGDHRQLDGAKVVKSRKTDSDDKKIERSSDDYSQVVGEKSVELEFPRQVDYTKVVEQIPFRFFGGIWHINDTAMRTANVAVEKILVSVAPRVYNKFLRLEKDSSEFKKIEVREIEDLLMTTAIFSETAFASFTGDINAMRFPQILADRPSLMQECTNQGDRTRTSDGSLGEKFFQLEEAANLHIKTDLSSESDIYRKTECGSDYPESNSPDTFQNGGHAQQPGDTKPKPKNESSKSTLRQENLKRLLLATAIGALRARRTLGDKSVDHGILGNETLRDISLLLKDRIYKENSESPPPDMHSLVYLMKEEIDELLEDAALQVENKTKRFFLIPSRAQRSMAAGVPGERIASALYMTQVDDSDHMDISLTWIEPIPERNGIRTVINDHGISKYGKVNFSWTTMAPIYRLKKQDQTNFTEDRRSKVVSQDKHSDLSKQLFPMIEKKELSIMSSPEELQSCPNVDKTGNFLPKLCSDLFSRKPSVTPKDLVRKLKLPMNPLPPPNTPKSLIGKYL